MSDRWQRVGEQPTSRAFIRDTKASTEFLKFVQSGTVLGGWVAEGQAIPLAKIVLTPFTTAVTRLATLIAFDARTLTPNNRRLFEQGRDARAASAGRS